MLRDMKALRKSLIVNLAIMAVWYAAEYKQFGELQWNRWGDNIIAFIYLIVLWWAFHGEDELIREMIKILKKDKDEN